MHVPEEVEQRIFADEDQAIKASCELMCENLHRILADTAGCGVPLGINVESVRCVVLAREECGIWPHPLPHRRVHWRLLGTQSQLEPQRKCDAFAAMTCVYANLSHLQTVDLKTR